jgi:hypothetical protein
MPKGKPAAGKRKRKTEFVPATPRQGFVRGGALSLDGPEPFNETDFAEITDPKRQMYLQAVARYPGLTLAAAKAGVSSKAAYLWRHEGDPVFDAAFSVARRLGLTRAESELWRRGIEGYDKPVYHQGQLIGTERVFSDTAAIFMLKGAKPDVYRERFEHSGPSGGPIETVAYSALTDEELRRRAEIVRDALVGEPGGPRANDLIGEVVTLPDTPETRYAAVLAARKANGHGSNGSGNGSNGAGGVK